MDRHERFLMRQRGAGTRQLGDFGFEISIPVSRRTPSSSGRKKRTSIRPTQRATAGTSTKKRTPEQPQSSAAKRTPGRPAGSKTKARGRFSVSKKQSPSSSAQKTTPFLEKPRLGKRRHGEIDETQGGTSGNELGRDSAVKRRKTNTSIAPETAGKATATQVVEPQPEGSREALKDAQLTSSIPRKRGRPSKTESLLKISTGNKSNGSLLGQAQAAESRSAAATPSAETTIAPSRKNLGLSHDSPIQKRKKRKSIGQQKKKQTSRKEILDDRPLEVGEDEQVAIAPKLPGAQKTKAGKSFAQTQAKRVQKKKNSRSREEVEQEIGSSSKNKSMRATSSKAPAPRARRGNKLLQNRELLSEERGASEEGEDDLEGVAPKSKKKERKRKTETTGKAGSSTAMGKKVVIAKPLLKRKATAKAQVQRNRLKNIAENEAEGKTSRKARSVPITVPRFSRHVHRLDFIPGEDDDLAGPTPFPKSKRVNAIDVLAQVFREMISNTIAKLRHHIENQTADSAKIAELKRTKKTYELFGDELENRLLDMTMAFNHDRALGTQLKQTKKKQAALQQEFLELRRERLKLELEVDALRRKHELESKAAQDENDLNEMLFDIEVAVQRGRELQRQEPQIDSHAIQLPKTEEEFETISSAQALQGLEARLSNISSMVSSAGGRQGLLDRIKGFNSLVDSFAT